MSAAELFIGMTFASAEANASLGSIAKKIFSVKGAALYLAETLENLVKMGLQAFITSIKDAMQSMDELSKSAAKVGVSTTEWSKLVYAANLADVSMETLASTMGKMTIKIAEAYAKGEEGAKAFEALGLSAANLINLKPEDAFTKIADAISKIENPMEKNKAAMAAFGKSYADLAPMIRGGSDEMKKLGEEAILSGNYVNQAQGEMAERGNDALTRLGGLWTGFYTQLMNYVYPALISITEGIFGFALESQSMGDIASNVWAIIQGAISAVMPLIQWCVGWYQYLALVITASIEPTLLILSAFEKLKNILIGGESTFFQDMEKSYRSFLSFQKDGILANLNSSWRENTNGFLNRSRDSADAARSKKDDVISGEASPVIDEKAAKEAERIQDAMQKTADQLFKSTRTAKEKYELEMEELNKIRMNTNLSEETYKRRVEQLKKERDSVKGTGGNRLTESIQKGSIEDANLTIAQSFMASQNDPLEKIANAAQEQLAQSIRIESAIISLKPSSNDPLALAFGR